MLTVLIAGGIAVFYLQKRMVKYLLPTVEEVYVKNLHIENGIGQVHLILSLENQDFMSYKVNSLQLSLNSNQTKLMTYQSDTTYVLAAGEKKTFDIDFEVNTKDLVRRIHTLQGADSTVISLRGNIGIEIALKHFKFDIHRDVKVGVPTPPDIKMTEVEYLGIRNGDSLDFNLHIAISNYNPNILGIRDASFELIVPEFIKAKGNLPDVELISSDTVVSIVPVTFVTKRKMELLSILLLKTEPLDYRFTLSGILLHRNELQSEIPISLVKNDQFSFDKKAARLSVNKIKFTNKKKKEKREQKENERK